MDMETLFVILIKQYGLTGLLLGFVLWREWRLLTRKKGYEALGKKIEEVNQKLEEHLKDAAGRITEFEVMKATQVEKNEQNERHYEKMSRWMEMIDKKIDKLFELGYGHRAASSKEPE